MFSGLYPIRMAVSEDDGASWSELNAIGDFGGIVAMSSVEAVDKTPGHYMALFHDDGRFIRDGAKPTKPMTMTLFQSRSMDGGLTWSQPEVIHASTEYHLCEPGLVRSPTAGNSPFCCEKTAGVITRRSSSPTTKERRGPSLATCLTA